MKEISRTNLYNAYCAFKDAKSTILRWNGFNDTQKHDAYYAYENARLVLLQARKDKK